MPIDKPEVHPEEAADEVLKLRAELERSQSIAHAAIEELQGFAYAASHDVKEALRSVGSFSQMLVRHAPPDPELAEYAQFVTDGIHTATAILDRMNMFARIDVSPRTSTLALAVPIQMAVLKLQPSISDAGASVTFNSLPEVNGNESQLQMLFENLIDNAIKYRSDDPPRVEISSEETDDGHLVCVRDNGVGIKPEYHEFVFQPFKRLQGKEIPGIGLGLAICSKIARGHQGRLWVESSGVDGSRFNLLLPY
ncbi:MAG TPA: ATP-binding protein [Bryobacteraceae bacterium]|jgi:chemotaxis family two-component system sensor kinase Cph1|nr:ATP-binding protein [Bryobacteraceae bacterium]